MKHILFTLVLALSPSVMSAQCPDNNHPHMIDLGLPSGIKWACCNVGAKVNTGYGGWFAWGETEEKEEYLRENYKWNYKSLTKYNGENNKKILEPEDDVAHVKWGNGWRMPTLDEMKELKENTTASYNKDNKIYFLKSKTNDAWIAFPTAGVYDHQDRKNESMGYYWTSTYYYTYQSRLSYCVTFDYYALYGQVLFRVGEETYEQRYTGLSVRAVHK